MSVNNLTRITPSAVIPSVVMPTFQDVPFEKYFAEKTSYGDIADDFLYLNTINELSAPTAIGQQWRIPETVQVSNSQLQYAYYTISARCECTADDIAKFAKLGMGIDLYTYSDQICEIAINQRRHYSALFGFNPNEIQGLIAMGTSATLPADSSAHTTLISYIPGELLQFIVSQASVVRTTTFGMAKPTIFASSSRVINYINSLIVPLTNYQMVGAGSDSVGGSYERVVGQMLGAGKIEFIEDNLLEGAGTGGADLIMIVAPGLNAQEADTQFAQTPRDRQFPANTFTDNPGDMRITVNPEINRVLSNDYSVKTTGGAVVRKNAVRVITAKYE